MKYKDLAVLTMFLFGSCQSTEKIKEEAIIDFLQISVGVDRRDIQKLIKLSEEHPEIFKLTYKEIQGTRYESVVRQFMRREDEIRYSNYERRLREQAIKVYIRCALEGEKVFNELIKSFPHATTSTNPAFDNFDLKRYSFPSPYPFPDFSK